MRMSGGQQQQQQHMAGVGAGHVGVAGGMMVGQVQGGGPGGGLSNESANGVILSLVARLRWQMGELLRCIYDGPGSAAAAGSMYEKENVSSGGSPAEVNQQFVMTIKRHIDEINDCTAKVEEACSVLSIPQSPPNLGNLGALCQDPGADRAALYSHVQTQVYPWTRQVEDFSTHLNVILQQNQLKRSQSSRTNVYNRSSGGPHRRALHNAGLMVPPQSVDFLLADLGRRYQDMTFKRHISSCTLVEVTLGHVLRALLVLRGIVVEQVLVKSYDESFFDHKSSQPDMWSQSTSKTFQKITENATTAVLHFCSPLMPNPDAGIRWFIAWLRSYQSLFLAPCKQCGQLLSQESMFPTWRDTRVFDPYHDTCRS